MRSRHSHTTSTVQPSLTRMRASRSSRLTLRSNFADQNATFDFGSGSEQCGQRCQKHPFTKMATLRPGKQMSGLPAAFFQCSL